MEVKRNDLMRRKLLFVTAALLAMTTASNAAVIGDLGPNPNTNLGRNPGAGAFDDQYLFQLQGAPAFITLASITNGFPGGLGSGQFIANFTGAVFNYGLDNTQGTADDVAVIGPTQATSPCQNETLCQALAGSATLIAGNYYFDLSGIAGATASYGGTISTFAVPGPRAGSFTIGSIIDMFK